MRAVRCHPNEAARHKLLDVVGDLALIGTRLKGKVIANKPGHFVNTQFAKRQYESLGAVCDNFQVIPQGIDLNFWGFRYVDCQLLIM